MAAVVVALSGVTRVNDAEALGTVWTGQTAAAVSEIEAFYQNTKSVSVKIKTTEGGPKYYNSATSHDYTTSNRTALLKMNVTSFTNLHGTAATSMIAEIGSGSRANYYRYYLHTNVTYPPDRSWLFVPINPNVAGYRDATVGTPVLTAVDYYGHMATMQTTAAKAENVVMDAIDFVDTGGGLLLTGGDGASTDGVLADFLTFDQGTTTNRYGLTTSRDGIFYVLGFWIFGSATATVVTDSNFTVVFPGGRFDAGFLGCKFDLQNATSAYTLSDGSFIGRGSKAGSADTRPDYTATGTSGSAPLTGVTFNTFRNWTLTSAVTLTNCTFLTGELVTQAGGTITGGKFSLGTGTHYILASSPSLLTKNVFTQGASGHAVRCDTTGTYTWDNKDTGYTGTRGTNLTESSGSTDACFYNNSGGLITLNVASGADQPSVRNGAGATTQVNATITLTITPLAAGSEVRAFLTGTPTAVDGTESSSGSSHALSLSSGVAVDIKIHNYTPVPYTPVEIINKTFTVSQSLDPVQQVERNYFNP